MDQGLRDTLTYHRSQRATWLALRDKLREPKASAYGRTVRAALRPPPQHRGSQLWEASAAVIRGCALTILVVGVTASIGIGLYHLVGLLPSLLPSSGPEALSFPFNDVTINPSLAAFNPSLWDTTLPFIRYACILGSFVGVAMTVLGYMQGVALSLAMGATFLATQFLRSLP